MVRFESPASDAVLNAEHPTYADGGPCHDCAFRKGTAASQCEPTAMLARLCVEGFREFSCHVHPGLCRGFIAALHLRGVPMTEAERRHCEASGLAADALGDTIRMIGR